MKSKIMFMFVTLFGVLLLAPYGVSAVSYPKVTNDTKEDTLVDEGTIQVTGSEAINVFVSGSTFKLLEAGTDPQEGATGGSTTRPAGYAWIGLHFKFESEVEEVKIGPAEGFDEKATTSNSNDFTEYFGISVADLKAAAKDKINCTKKYVAKWTDAEGKEQELPIQIMVVTENVKLLSSDGGTEEWNHEKYLDESNQWEIHYTVFDDEDVFNNTILWDKDTPLTAKDVEEWVKLFDGYHEKSSSLLGTYTSQEKEEKFVLGKTLEDNTTIYVEVGPKKETVKNPETGDQATTYMALMMMTLILSFGSILYLRKENN